MSDSVSFGSPAVPPAPPPRSRLGWYVAGGVLVLVLAIGGAVLALTGGDATTVRAVAEQAVEAAEDLDVDTGIDLLCEAPTDTERRELEDLIAEGQEESGTDEPDIDYEISEVEGETTGSFRVRVTSDEPGLESKELDAVVIVEEHDGRSCIAGFEDED